MERYKRLFESMTDKEILTKLGDSLSIKLEMGDLKYLNFFDKKKFVRLSDSGGKLGHFVSGIRKDIITKVYGWKITPDEFVDWLRKNNVNEVKSEKGLTG